MLCFVSHWPSGVMKTTWRAYSLVPLGLLVLGTTGCETFRRTLGIPAETGIAIEDPLVDDEDEPVASQAQNTDGDSKVLLNAEAGIELTLPAAWSQDSRLHDSAELQASDISNQLYIVVVAEEDKTLSRLGLRENASNYRRLLTNQLQSLQGQSPTDVAFVGDNFASQYEIRGQVDTDTPVIYLHTTVVTESRYYQIVAWTTPSQYNAYKSELQTITETFREVDTASSL